MRAASFGPDARRARHGSLVARRDGRRERARLECGQDRERHLRADSLDPLKKPKPFPLVVRAEAVEPDHVLPDMGLD
jgi:hypothetical protein